MLQQVQLANNGAHAVGKHKTGEARVSHRGGQLKLTNVAEHTIHRFQITTMGAGLPVSAMIGGVDRKAPFSQGLQHMNVASRVFTHTVENEADSTGIIRHEPAIEHLVTVADGQIIPSAGCRHLPDDRENGLLFQTDKIKKWHRETDGLPV